MNNLHQKTLSTACLLFSVACISACSNVRGFFNGGEEVNYQNSQSVKLLEVPADLTTPSFDSSFTLPEDNHVGSTKANISPPKFDFASGTKGASSLNGKRVSSSVINSSGRAVLKVNSDYSSSLLATESNLEKMGFEVIGKSSGVITAKFTEVVVLVSETTISSLLKLVVGSDGKRLVNYEAALETDVVYLVSVSNEANAPIVRFTRKDNKKISDEAHTKIIELLNTSFNS